MDCNSRGYKAFQSLVAILIVIYQSIPIMWFVLLWRARDVLRPEGLRHQPDTADPGGEVKEFRDVKDPRIRHLAFLWADYRPEWYSFEVIDMVSVSRYWRILIVHARVLRL